MGRTGEKSAKKKVTFEELPAKKRAKVDAQKKNAAELKQLLALKTCVAVEDPEIGPTGHLFVDGTAPVIDNKQSTAGGVSEVPEKKVPSDPLATEGSEHGDDIKDPGQNSDLDASDQDASDQDGPDESDPDASESEENRPDDTSFPMPIKINPDNDEDEKVGHSKVKNEMRDSGTRKEPTVQEKPTREFLLNVITDQRDKLRQLKAKNQVLEEEKKNLENLTVRLARENMAIKDSKNIPRAKFTAVPGINITVEQLQQLNQQTTKTSVFIALLVVKLVGNKRLMNMSVTGKPCQRFRNKRNSDGTATHPAKEKLDPKIFKFICEKVAERAAMIHGAENVVLVLAEANEANVRLVITNKIQNLRRAQLIQAAQLEGSGSPSEKEEGATQE